jgi:hypothetical protein
MHPASPALTSHLPPPAILPLGITGAAAYATSAVA